MWQALNIPLLLAVWKRRLKITVKRKQENRSCFFLGNVQKYLPVFFRKRSPGFSA